MAYVVGGLDILFVIYLVYYRWKTRIAVDLLRLTTKPMKSLRAVFLFPVFQVGIGLVVVMVLILVLLYTMSTGDVVKFEDQNIPGGEAKRIEFSVIEKYLMVYCGVLILWWMACIAAFGEFIIAGAVAVWYFTREKSTLDNPFRRAVFNFARFHLGSVILGTLANTTMRLPRLCCRPMRRHLDKYENSASKKVKCFTDCCCCCFESYERLIRYVTKYLYNYMSIYGEKFIISGKRSFFLIERNLPRVLVPSRAGNFVIF
jgi:solute carrier family 44 protein 1 (choline transporter-like protein)